MRDEIVAAAEQLLTERGSMAAVTVADIVGRVGVTAPVLYQHFADKEGLFVEVHARRTTDFRDFLRRSARRGDPPLTALEKRGRAYIRYATSRRDAYVALFMTPNSLGMDVFRDPRTVSDTAFDDLVANVQACVNAGEIPPCDVQLAARIVWAQVHGLASLLIAMPEIADGVGQSAMVDRMIASITASLVAN